MTSPSTLGRIAATAAVFALLGAGSAVAQDDDLSRSRVRPEEVLDALLDELPPLVFGEDGVETLVLEGVFRPLHHVFTLHSRGGESYDLLLTGLDGAQPFMAGRDGVSLAYTPGDERGRVQLFPGLAQIHLALEEERLRFGIALVGAPSEEIGDRVTVTLDPASLLRRLTDDVTLEWGSGQRYRLSGVSPTGTRCEVDVDPEAVYPVVALRATPKDAEEPAIEITKLVVNPKSGPRILGIPSVETLSEHFECEDLRIGDADEAVAKAMGATYSATGARMRMAVASESSDPAEKAASLRDLKERRKLGGLLRAAAK